MKRDARLKRNGERVLLGYGGQHRRPRYSPCPAQHSSVIARVARSMRIPIGILGLGTYGVCREAIRAAEHHERQAAIIRLGIESVDAPTLRLTADRLSFWVAP